jgi:hypothetical protein
MAASFEPVLKEVLRRLKVYQSRHILLPLALLSVEKEKVIKNGFLRTELKICCTDTHTHVHITVLRPTYTHIRTYILTYTHTYIHTYTQIHTEAHNIYIYKYINI